MKMVKSLLLGSAAGLVAMAGAQAADLPVKAKPVQYVKICSLYGAGFYYIPGTDMCLKIGGWVRAEYAWGSHGNFAWGWANDNPGDRSTHNSVVRARGYITADARNQTEYGTLRSYIAVGLSTNDLGLNTAANTFSANRAFIQFAGFTFGLAQSFYDFYSVPATSYWGMFPASDTGDPGWWVAAYTAQFGNGFSASLSVETRRMTRIDLGIYTPGLGLGGGYGGFQVPDLVGNLRVDQAWGSAQIMGALHHVNGQYYGGAFVPATGHPEDEVGWVIGAGLKLNAPMIGRGDYFQGQVNYTEGALRYVFMTPNSNWSVANQAADGGFGPLMDASYGGTIAGGNATGLELTTAWGFNAAYEHIWVPGRWKTSLYGGYAEVNYGNTANNTICSGNPNIAILNCDLDWSTWWIGSRTQWNVTKEFYVGVDVLYSRLQSADWGVVGVLPNTAFTTTYGPLPKADQDNWAIRLRAHRDFYP